MDSQKDAAKAALEPYRLHHWRETGRELGRGSYATVVEVDYKGLKCAGKKVFRVLYEQGVGDLVSRFEEECRLLSQLRHPHVVQFLGIYFGPDSADIPVLVMELLPITLSECLSKYGIMPKSITYRILHDVALGLRYLHDREQPIFHRDLSANNVLLTGDMRAKISDLGVAKILHLTADQCSHMTRKPGTLTYMPPEALSPNPLYGIKVDIFSYGVMIIHTLSACWPVPSEAILVNPKNPAELTPVSEVGRRKTYLDKCKFEREDPLQQLIYKCLHNSPAHRPDATYIAQQVGGATSRVPPTFQNRVEMETRIQQDMKQNKSLKEQNTKLTQAKEAATNQKVTLLCSQVQERDEQLTSQKKELEATVSENHTLKKRVKVLTQDKEVSEKETSAIERRFQFLSSEKDASERENEAKSLQLADLRLEINELQADVARMSKLMAHKDDVHMQALLVKQKGHEKALAQKDQAYKNAMELKDDALKSKDEAHQLAVSLLDRAHREALAHSHQAHQAEVLSQESILQASQTEVSLLRQELAAARDATSRKEERISHLRNELSHCVSHLTSSHQQPSLLTPGVKLTWKYCGRLPFATHSAQAVVIHGIVYVGGGWCVNDVERCTVCRYHPGEAQWDKLPPAPVMIFGIGKVSGQLVLVGGRETSTKEITGDVHIYVSESQEWEKSLPAMPTPRTCPSVESCPSVLIACGGSGKSRPVPTVEVYVTDPSQWYQCAPLPHPRSWMSSVKIGDILFLVGGYEGKASSSVTKSVFYTQLSNLVDRAVNHSGCDDTLNNPWKALKDVPYHHSAAASNDGCLVAIGGSDKPSGGKVSDSIHVYIPATSSWHPLCRLPWPTDQATAVLLATHKFFIVGGCDSKHTTNENVYMGTLKC